MERLTKIGGRLHRRAENIAVLMLAVMFAAFIVQIASRYVFNLPVGAANELTITMWLWVVLWGAAFVLRERDEIRFDVIYGVVGPGVRRVMTLIAAAGLIFLYGYSLPAVWDYVTFMRVQSSSYLNIRYDWLYSIYITFAVAVLIRYIWIFVSALRGRVAEDVQRGDGQA